MKYCHHHNIESKDLRSIEINVTDAQSMYQGS